MSKALLTNCILVLFSLFATNLSIAPGALRVGAARVDITPASNAPSLPSGKYAHERLYVRAIVLDNGASRAALIGADQGGLSEEIWEAASKKIAEELKCPLQNIVVSATHTHSGWGPGGFRALTDSNAPPAPIIGQMVDAVRQAKTKLQPARVGFGTGLSYLNVNRDAVDPDSHLWTQASNLDGPSDKTVAVLEFLGLNGQPIAVYMNYAMHPVNGFLSGFTSADFAGAASRYVEQAFDDKPIAVFAQGASGDQNPLYLRAATNALASRSKHRSLDMS
jgi:neutral ceramidase